MLKSSGKDLKMSFIIMLYKEEINILEIKEKEGSRNRNKNYKRIKKIGNRKNTVTEKEHHQMGTTAGWEGQRNISICEDRSIEFTKSKDLKEKKRFKTKKLAESQGSAGQQQEL